MSTIGIVPWTLVFMKGVNGRLKEWAARAEKLGGKEVLREDGGADADADAKGKGHWNGVREEVERWIGFNDVRGLLTGVGCVLCTWAALAV